MQCQSALHLHRLHMEKRIVRRWKMYVKYARRYRKCLKRTKQWYLRGLLKRHWEIWNRQYLYYSELHLQSQYHFETNLKIKIIKEWQAALDASHKINEFLQKQYFSKWIGCVRQK